MRGYPDRARTRDAGTRTRLRAAGGYSDRARTRDAGTRTRLRAAGGYSDRARTRDAGTRTRLRAAGAYPDRAGPCCAPVPASGRTGAAHRYSDPDACRAREPG
ncbi:hypothetical protein GCM10010512_31300 [Streptomyces thermoviolaceus subsp. thermoviolaceus]|nr:hypothetical protein GCM10010512_31300 [Streptomyces thermoviolaceus subsp. thermoviolaceus]